MGGRTRELVSEWTPSGIDMCDASGVYVCFACLACGGQWRRAVIVCEGMYLITVQLHHRVLDLDLLGFGGHGSSLGVEDG